MNQKNGNVFFWSSYVLIIFSLFAEGFVSRGKAKSGALDIDQTMAAYFPIMKYELPPTPPEVCNRAAFLGDITIPDGTDFAPGARFVKTWQLRNDGFCTWAADYAVVFIRGDLMSGPSSQPISTQPVLPGQKVNISITFTAPLQPGSYQGFWKLRDTWGITFGIGKTNEPFHALIDVVK